MIDAPTKISFGESAIKKILKGLIIGYNAVRLSMGPEGKNAIIYGTYGRDLRITNDGYTILDCIELKDEFEALGINALKEATKKTNRQVGDGTSATTTIGGKGAIDVFAKLNEHTTGFGGQKSLGVMTVRKQLLETATEVEKQIKEKSKPVDSLEKMEQIAIVSVENPEIGKKIAEMTWKTGTNGFIDVVEGFKGETEYEMIEGARFPARIGAKGFVNNPAQKLMEAKDTHVLLVNYDLEDVNTVAGFLDPLIKDHGITRLAVFAPQFSKEVLEAFWGTSYKMLNNGQRQRTGIDLFPVRVSSLRTEQFEDLEVYFGGRFIDKQKGLKLENIRKEDLGFAERIVVKDTDSRDDAIALGGQGTKPVIPPKGESPSVSHVELRIKELTSQIKEEKMEAHQNLLKRRIASLGSSVGVIRVCESIEGETFYMKKKIEDAVYACKAAMEEGYVKGGGLCLKEIAETLEDSNLLKQALLQPYKQIQENVGGKLEIGENIIDPAKGIRLSVHNAVSMIATLITIGVAIPRERELAPAEGYVALAKSLDRAILAWKKFLGILDENDKEIARDTQADHDNIIRDNS